MSTDSFELPIRLNVQQDTSSVVHHSSDDQDTHMADPASLSFPTAAIDGEQTDEPIESDEVYDATDEGDEYEYVYLDEEGNEILAEDIDEEEYEFEEVGEDDAEVVCEDEDDEEYEYEEYEEEVEEEDGTAELTAEGEADEYEDEDEDDAEYDYEDEDQVDAEYEDEEYEYEESAEDELETQPSLESEADEINVAAEGPEPELEGYELVKSLIDRQDVAIEKIDQLDAEVVGMIDDLTGRDESEIKDAA